MNGFASHGLDEDAFGEKSGLQGGLKTFDAFRTWNSVSMDHFNVHNHPFTMAQAS